MPGIVKKWLFAVLFLATLVVLLAGSLPLLVEELILPSVLSRAGLSGCTVAISRLGLNGCTLHISGKPEVDSPVLTGDIRIDWTPADLYRGKIKTIAGHGLRINLAGLPVGKNTGPVAPEKGQAEPSRKSFPLLVDKVVIDNGLMEFSAGGRSRHLPISVAIDRVVKAEPEVPAGTESFQVRVQAAQIVMNGNLSLNFSQGTLSAIIDSALDLQTLAQLSPYPLPVRELKGKGMFRIDMATRLSPFTLESLESSVIFDTLSADANGFGIRNREQQLAMVSLAGAGNDFQIQGSGLEMMTPLPASLAFAADCVVEKNTLRWNGTIDLAPERDAALGGGFVLQDVSPLKVAFEGTRTEGVTELRAATALSQQADGGSALVIGKEDLSAAAGQVMVRSEMTMRRENAERTVGGTLSVEGKDIAVTSGTVALTIPEFDLEAKGSLLPGMQYQDTAASLRVTDGALTLEGQDIEAKGIALWLPVAWQADDNRKGSFRVAEVRRQGTELGSAQAELFQEGNGVRIDGFALTPLFPKEKLLLKGSVQLSGTEKEFAEFTVDLENGRLDPANFSSLLPALKGMTGEGRVSARGDITLSSCGPAGTLDLAFTGGSFRLKDAETEIEGISLGLHFPSLPALASDPMQQLAVGSMRKGKVVVSDVKAVFEIESPGSLFVEKVSGRWSGGRLFTSSFRLGKGREDFDFALFCDRLELSSILSQFGLAEAGGEGRMSGRIPVAIGAGKIFVDDGFLFSTPGEKGHLKIRQSKYLETSIPAGVTHFSPLQFAGAALADFEYNWAKLQIKSEEENLTLKLQVDGKPREKLPYRFDTATNAFVRVEDESKGGIDQPVKLDVNFNVPVNELLLYKDTFMPILRNLN